MLVSNPNMRSDVTESLSIDLSKVSKMLNLWDMGLNPNKTYDSRSSIIFSSSP